MVESTITIAERYYNQLVKLLMANLPRPGQPGHPYSHGALLKGVRKYKNYARGEFHIIISEGVPYSRLALGYNEDGSKRTPRGIHEANNFRILEREMLRAKQIVRSGFRAK